MAGVACTLLRPVVINCNKSFTSVFRGMPGKKSNLGAHSISRLGSTSASLASAWHADTKTVNLTSPGLVPLEHNRAYDETARGADMSRRGAQSSPDVRPCRSLASSWSVASDRACAQVMIDHNFDITVAMVLEAAMIQRFGD